MRELINVAARIMLLALVVTLAGCSQKSKLQVGVELANKQCPISLGVAGEVTDIAFDGTDVLYSISVDESYLNLEALEQHPEIMKAGIVSMFGNPSGELKTMLELVIETGSGMQYIYKGKTSGKEVVCHLSTEDLKNALENPLPTTEDVHQKQLEEAVNLTNISLPMQLDEFTRMDKLTIEDKQVVYHYSIDEEMIDMDALESNAGQLKQGAKDSWSIEDASMRMFLEACMNCEKGIVYRYVGNTSGKVVEVVFDVAEIKALFTE